MPLPKSSPKDFCTAFIKRELEDYKESNIWMGFWLTMERMIDRADELNTPYTELINKYGYSDKQYCDYVWLILEHIWASVEYSKAEVENARSELKELNQLSEEITNLASRLSTILERQEELYEYSGFIKADYQSVSRLLTAASENNYLYQSYVADKVRSFESKYWPNRADLVQAIADFEKQQPEPEHSEYPDAVLKGRPSNIKNFVITFDTTFDDQDNCLPMGFRFSNNAMADIINVILDVSPENLVMGDAVRVVRNRHCKKMELTD